MAVKLRGGGVIFAAHLHAGDVADAHHRAAGLALHDDIFKLIDRLQARLGADGGGQLLGVRRGQRADFTGGDLHVLRFNRALHVGRHQRVGRQLRRVEPDAHGVFRPEHLQAADALHARQRVLHIAHQPVGDIRAAGGVGFVVHAHDQQEVALRFLDGNAGLLHLGRQARFRLLDLVLHLHLGGVRVGSLLEGDGNAHRPVRAAGGGEVEQVIQPGELLLDHLRHAVFQRLRGGAGVGGRDFDRRRSNVRILRDRQRADRQHPGEHDENGDNPGKDRATHEEAGKHQAFPPLAFISSAFTSCPAATLSVPSTISLSPALRPLSTSHLSP